MSKTVTTVTEYDDAGNVVKTTTTTVESVAPDASSVPLGFGGSVR